MTNQPRRRWGKLRPRISPRTSPGAPPGTLAVDPHALPPTISVIAYDAGEIVEETVDGVDAIRKLRERWPVVWVNVDGLGDARALQSIGDEFGLHPLALEDVVNANQRPKLELFDEHLLVIARMPELSETGLRSEQLSLFLGSGFVLTFQEREGDCFDPVRKRIRAERRERFLQPDYLAYALLDALIDSYFPVLEAFGEGIDRLEESITDDPHVGLVSQIQDTRHNLLGLRRAIWPERDLLTALARDPIPQISDTTRTYLRDCYDHAVRIIDLVETYRELSSGLTELYQSTVGHRMNEIMKVLTIMATIFIPLTFVAGIYGMNFNTETSPWNMPELGWYWGYPFTLLLMAVIVVGMILYFRKRGWVG